MNVNEARFIRHEQDKGDNMYSLKLRFSRRGLFDVLNENEEFIGIICAKYDNEFGIGRPQWRFTLARLDIASTDENRQITKILDSLNL